MIKAIITLILCGLLFLIGYEVFSRHQKRKEIEQMVTRCPIVYLCEKSKSGYTVTRILKNDVRHVTHKFIVEGASVELNRQRIKDIDKGWEKLEVMVFIEPGNRTLADGNFLNQNEIPIISGILTSYRVSVNDIAEMVRAIQN